MKTSPIILLIVLLFTTAINSYSENDPYSIELERIYIPGAPSIHSFSFAESNGRWLFVGGRTNGLHGFNPNDAFPKQYSNKNIFVVDPNTNQTFSKNIFVDCSYSLVDPLRSTNMQYFQDGNKLYITGGYGYDSASNGLITFPTLTVIDVNEIIQAIMTGSSIAPYIRQITDSRMQVCGGEMMKLGEYFYLAGGHKFMGTYSQTTNDQVYTNKIQKFKITDNGVSISITDYSFYTDTAQYHRRDMNLVPAIKPDGVNPYLTLYGGVFIHGTNLPFLNPIYIDGNIILVDNSFNQKMSQYTCSYLSAFDNSNGDMHTTFFGGMSLYYYNEITQMLEYDSLVPFINDITTLTKNAAGVSHEKISQTKMPALLGTNAKFILNGSVPQFNNKVVKLSELTTRTYAGIIYGGIRAVLPNNTPSFPSDYILKVYITPKSVNINNISGIVPDKFELYQNYPNPFNPITKIRFSISENSVTKVLVYDELGREVTKLVDSKLNAGVYEVNWDGSGFSSGVYFFRLQTNSYTETKKMLLIR